jgi:hypothetical protein
MVRVDRKLDGHVPRLHCAQMVQWTLVIALNVPKLNVRLKLEPDIKNGVIMPLL